MKEVTEALVTYGLYVLVIRVEAKSLGHLDMTLTDITQIEEIEQLTHLSALKHADLKRRIARMRVPKLVKNGFYSSFTPLSLTRACLMG